MKRILSLFLTICLLITGTVDELNKHADSENFEQTFVVLVREAEV